jgi:cytochrome c551/c552
MLIIAAAFCGQSSAGLLDQVKKAAKDAASAGGVNTQQVASQANAEEEDNSDEDSAAVNSWIAADKEIFSCYGYECKTAGGSYEMTGAQYKILAGKRNEFLQSIDMKKCKIDLRKRGDMEEYYCLLPDNPKHTVIYITPSLLQGSFGQQAAGIYDEQQTANAAKAKETYLKECVYTQGIAFDCYQLNTIFVNKGYEGKTFGISKDKHETFYKANTVDTEFQISVDNVSGKVYTLKKYYYKRSFNFADMAKDGLGKKWNVQFKKDETGRNNYIYDGGGYLIEIDHISVTATYKPLKAKIDAAVKADEAAARNKAVDSFR